MFWPFEGRYPEQTAEEVDGRCFDYIIAGGGTAACVIASRLSEDPTVSVLIISRGHVRDDWLSRIPLVGQALQKDGPQNSVLYAEPDGRWDGKQVHLYTSQALGGATRINGLMLTRGAPANYDRWAELGNNEWSWDKCEPWYRKMENASLCHPGAERRGHHGPLVLRHMPSLFRVDEYWERTAKDVGLPFGEDANDPEAQAMGIYTIDTMIDRAGQRLSAQRAYLPKSVARERRGRLTICTGAVVAKLRLCGSGDKVEGVYIINNDAKRSSRQCYVAARREVVVSCGALFTPQVLMLSGIGPKNQVELHGIPVIHDLPGVGSNLSDHVSFGIAFEVMPRDSYISLMRPLIVLWNIILFIVYKSGLLASLTTKHCIWARTSALDDGTMQVQALDSEKRDNMDASQERNIPDLEYMLVGASFDEDYVKTRGYYGLYTTLAQPHSKGRVALASDDPFAHPKVHHPYITDERDWLVARKGARFAMHVIERFRTKGYPFQTVWHRAPGMKAGSMEGSWRHATDEEIDDFVKKRINSALHATSTCRMGSAADGGVVQQDLKVHGIRNLRVADASVFPALPSAHTVAPTYMVAERCAGFIKQNWAT